MASHYLAYTPWKSIKSGGRPASPRYFYTASSQFDRMGLQAGDTIWQVSVRPESGKLLLCGCLVVHYVTSDVGEARRRIAHYTAEPFLWPAKWHAFAREGAEEPYAEVCVHDLAPALRFASEHDRLTLDEGRVNPQQLQAIRRLAPESAELLAGRWGVHREARAAGRSPERP